uniref:TAZ-type domain-containing protein n=1 Tax=Angiostrongylus cantonensis TaxID=6313 RepID=A0A0K0DHJ9_ANGCA
MIQNSFCSSSEFFMNDARDGDKAKKAQKLRKNRWLLVHLGHQMCMGAICHLSCDIECTSFRRVRHWMMMPMFNSTCVVKANVFISSDPEF